MQGDRRNVRANLAHAAEDWRAWDVAHQQALILHDSPRRRALQYAHLALVPAAVIILLASIIIHLKNPLGWWWYVMIGVILLGGMNWRSRLKTPATGTISLSTLYKQHPDRADKFTADLADLCSFGGLESVNAIRIQRAKDNYRVIFLTRPSGSSEEIWVASDGEKFTAVEESSGGKK